MRAAPELTKISFPGMDPCAIGSIVEVLVITFYFVPLVSEVCVAIF